MVIKKSTYKDQVISFIYRNMLNGTFKPGTRLNENRLAEELQISRAPIREAFKELTADGLINYKPHIGNFIVDISCKNIIDTYITRGVLEGYAARCSLSKLEGRDFDELYKMADDMEGLALSSSDSDRLKLIDLGDMFHKYIFSKSDNEQLVEFTMKLSLKSHLMFSKYWFKLYKPTAIRKRHRDIVDCLSLKDGFEVENVIRKHYGETGAKIADLKKKGV